MFKKTTNFDFQQYGDIYTENTPKEADKEARDYLVINNKSVSHLYKADEFTSFRVIEGIAIVVVTHDLYDSPEPYVIHRICNLHKGVYYNFISITAESTIEINGVDLQKDILYPLEEPYVFKPYKPSLSVSEILGNYFVVRKPNYHFYGEIHHHWELTYVDDGTLYTDVETTEYTIESHSYMFYAPEQFHTQRTVGTCSYLTVVFDMEIDPQRAKLLTNTVFTAGPEEKVFLEDFLRKGSTADQYSIDVAITALQRIVINTLQMKADVAPSKITTSMQQKYQNELLNEIIQYINENIYSPINVGDLCYKFSISRSSIQSLFKNTLNTTPKEFISDLKFSKSKQMIKESKYSISEISRICGFTSIHYFSRKFKEHFGVNPTSYAKSIG